MKFGYTINNKLMMNSNGKLIGVEVNNDPYNPLGLPSNTMRVRTNDGKPPIKNQFTNYETATLVEGKTDVYDVYKSGNRFYRFLEGSTNVIEVLGANTNDVINMNDMFNDCISLTSISLFDTSTVKSMNYMFNSCSSLSSVPLFNTSNVTEMISMFGGCTSLTSVPLFNTSNVTSMNTMFYNCKSLTSFPQLDTNNVIVTNGMFWLCTSLTSIPLFDTSNVSSMSEMFRYCTNVQSGALDLYQQASTQTNPPINHSRTFEACGQDTQTGSAELAQIPSDWK